MSDELYGFGEDDPVTYSSINDALFGGTGASKYEQQTFLGLSIASWNATAGFGDSSSSLTVDLVQDELNNSDAQPSGTGHDVYWDVEIGDKFAAIPAGSPVFFSFGRERASTKDAFLHVLDSFGGYESVETVYAKKGDIGGTDSDGKTIYTAGQYKGGTRGHNHFTFAGILQAYNQSLSANGQNTYQVKVTDAREILSNVTLILNGYQNSLLGMTNLMNVYGLLEHNPENATLREIFEPDYYLNQENIDKGYVLPQISDGTGTDMYYADTFGSMAGIKHNWKDNVYTRGLRGDPLQFPITGTGMSRRDANGIPYYRVMQGINTLLNFNRNIAYSVTNEYGEYSTLGLYNGIMFRGLRYAIDMSGLPMLSYGYKLNYDQMNLLELAMEICEVANHELYVDLLPVLDHPITRWAYTHNRNVAPENMFVGIISMRSIDKSSPSEVGKIQEYINDLPEEMECHTKDVGYELANETLDKIVIGAQDVSTYIFPSNHRYDYCAEDAMQTNYQIIPYYGKLNDAATIPKGFGSYSQILLDAGNLFANAVGDTYVATEMELRAAAISYEKWVEFLLQYNDLYMESVEDGDIRDIGVLNAAIAPGQSDPVEISSNYCVTVPRNLWPPKIEDAGFNTDAGQANNPCHPPYGWPLYWHRAKAIGVPEAGMANISLAANRAISDLENQFGDDNSSDDEDNNKGRVAPKNKSYIKRATSEAASIIGQSVNLGRAGLKNARTIHAFLKKIADECLGKKWLVKIPQRVNYNYSNTLADFNSTILAQTPGSFFSQGPFGFAPRDVRGNFKLPDNISALAAAAANIISGSTIISQYLNPAPESTAAADPLGALKVGVNRDEPYTVGAGGLLFNYYTEPQGGWYPYDATWTDNNINMGLIPLDFSFLKNDNGRLSAYVRYDNSENLDFSSFSAGDFRDQKVDIATGKINPNFISEESYQMEGTKNTSFPASNSNRYRSDQKVHYVKVSVDEDYVIAPRFKSTTCKLFGGGYGYDIRVSEPTMIFDDEECKEKPSYRYIQRSYHPVSGTQSMGNPRMYIDLDNPGLDYRNGVYALITVPGKVAAHISSAFREGMDMSVQNVGVKHILQADVYKYVHDFQTPKVDSGEGSTNVFASALHPSGLPSDSRALIRKAYEGLTYCLNNRLNIVSPSPVYPDLVALPLRSEERCYGPWSSISTNGTNYNAADKEHNISATQVGGKVEFVKDESLAPWNFGGYTYMTYTGENQCQLGMSALMVSERGGFSVASTPSGISLCDYLLDYGPVVTNISVDFDATGAAKTTYTMNSYTTSFGKLQKQRSDELKKLSRLRKQMWDQRNKETRRMSGKNQKNTSYSLMLKGLEGRMNMLQYNNDMFKDYQQRSTSYSTVISKGTVAEKRSDGSTNGLRDSEGKPSWSNLEKVAESSMQTDDDMRKASENIAVDGIAAASSFANSASEKPEDVSEVASKSPHPTVPSAKGRPSFPHPNYPEVDDKTSGWYKNK